MDQSDKYDRELHKKASAIAKKFMFDGLLLTSKGQSADVTWFEATLQGLQAIIPFKIEWLNEACMGLGTEF